MDNPLVQPDPGLFFWTIATFLLLLFLLKKFAWGPLMAALDERQSGIRESLAGAQEARGELERLQQESREIISQARSEAQAIVAKGKSESEKLRTELKQSAKAEADAILRQAEKQIQVEKEKAISQIKNEVVDLSLLVATRLIGKNLSREDSQLLVEESLKKFESYGA